MLVVAVLSLCVGVAFSYEICTPPYALDFLSSQLAQQGAAFISKQKFSSFRVVGEPTLDFGYCNGNECSFSITDMNMTYMTSSVNLTGFSPEDVAQSLTVSSFQRHAVMKFYVDAFTFSFFFILAPN